MVLTLIHLARDGADLAIPILILGPTLTPQARGAEAQGSQIQIPVPTPTHRVKVEEAGPRDTPMQTQALMLILQEMDGVAAVLILMVAHMLIPRAKAVAVAS